MHEYLIVVESGYKTTSANYRIWASEPLSQEAARQRFAALRAGADEALPAVAGAQVIDASDGQFLRLHKVRGALVLDRVTVGPASTQQ